MNLKKYVLLFRWHNFEDFDIDDILIDEKPSENILIYEIPYKSLIDLKPFCIRFDKVDEFIRIYDKTRYLTLFGSDNRIRHLISLKSSITYVFPHY